MQEDNSYSIYTHARPIRTAFLIDPDKSPEELLDAIYDFNLEQWGGRFNPLIPVSDGQISDSYLKLLKLTDPDILYTFAKLPVKTIAQVEKYSRPIHFTEHKEMVISGKPHYAVRSDHLARLDFHHCIGSLSSHMYPSPAVLVCRASASNTSRRIIQRNFGAYDDTPIGNKLGMGMALLSLEEDFKLRSALEDIATSHMPLIYPIHCASMNASHPSVRESYKFDLLSLTLAEDAWSWVWAWNRVFLKPQYMTPVPRIREICLPASILTDENTVGIVRKLLSKFAYHWGSGGSPRVSIESHSLPDKELQGLADILYKGINVSCLPQKYNPRECPDFEADDSLNPQLSKTTHYRFGSRKAFVPIEKPDFVCQRSKQNHWMLDSMIEYRPELSSYTNVTYWWQLPHPRNITRLFSQQAGRVTNGALPSWLVSEGLQHIEIKIPDDAAVFSYIFTVSENPRFTTDVRTRQEVSYEKVRLSDKGRYLNGFVGLFPDLFNAYSFLENHFWRETCYWMCKRNVSREHAVKERISNRIKKALPKIKEQPEEKTVGYLRDLVLREARLVSTMTREISFEQLLKRLLDERQRFEKEAHYTGEFPTDRKTAIADLRDALSNLTAQSVLIQGVKPRCTFCGMSEWYSVQEIGSTIRCRGCQGEFLLPVEAHWSYRLNELIARALTYHGVVPVVWTLGKLLAGSRTSFLYIPGLELYKSLEDTQNLAEVDIACISDGRLLIGEVKSSASEFSNDDFEKLEVVTRAVRADCVVVAAFEGDTEAIVRAKENFEERVSDLEVEVIPLMPVDELSAPSYHI